MHRREFVEQMAGTTALGVFGATLVDLEAAGNFAALAPAEQPYEFLKPDQVELLDAVTAQIVPTDDTPGAREAHVVRFIDRALATFWQPRRERFATVTKQFETFATAWKNGNTPFVHRITGDQVSILQDFERAHPDSFSMLRNMTMAGMFSHPEHGGNYGRVGWKLIGYEPQYSWVPPFGYYDR